MTTIDPVTALFSHRRQPAPDEHMCSCGTYREACLASRRALHDLAGPSTRHLDNRRDRRRPNNYAATMLAAA